MPCAIASLLHRLNTCPPWVSFGEESAPWVSSGEAVLLGAPKPSPTTRQPCAEGEELRSIVGAGGRESRDYALPSTQMAHEPPPPCCLCHGGGANVLPRCFATVRSLVRCGGVGPWRRWPCLARSSVSFPEGHTLTRSMHVLPLLLCLVLNLLLLLPLLPSCSVPLGGRPPSSPSQEPYL